MADPRNALMPDASLLQYLQPWQERAPYRAPENPYLPPWAYPEWTARHGEMRAPAERPKDWSAPIAESISPTMGGYGLGSGAASAYSHAREQEWLPAAGEAAMLAAGMIAPGPKAQPRPGIRAYHGSPHDFDRFSMDKIGTGEGAQAYGHGLYFAENEGVARQYRKNLSRSDGGIDQIAQTLVDQAGGDWKKALQTFEGEALDRVRSARAAGLKYELPPYDVAILQSLRKGEPGRTYEVRIDADPADFLDWDKPLSQQSEKVRGALKPFTQPRVEELSKSDGPGYVVRGGEPTQTALTRWGANRIAERMKPIDAVEDLIAGFGNREGDQRVSQALRDAGIPGIRYLDQGSRGSGEGTHNYVLFRDDIINIVRKYGIAAAASMYGMDAVLNATGQRNALMPEDQ